MENGTKMDFDKAVEELVDVANTVAHRMTEDEELRIRLHKAVIEVALHILYKKRAALNE